MTTNKLVVKHLDEDTPADEESMDALSLTADRKQRRNKKTNKNEIDDAEHQYAEYPIDIWHLIGRFVRPEDVCRFALICRQTAYVASTSSFWLNLYKSNYRAAEVLDLPVRLQPDCMVRIGGLRACVIRSLFYIYRPFIERLPTLAGQDFHLLTKRECITSWCKQIKDNWVFCYKLRQKFAIGSRQEISERLRKSKRFIEFHNDPYQNSEEGCKILVVCMRPFFQKRKVLLKLLFQIKTASFRPLIQHFNQQLYLGSINQSLSQGFIHHKLKMSFVNHCQEHIASVIYDPVLEIQTLDWWTPAYHTYLK